MRFSKKIFNVRTKLKVAHGPRQLGSEDLGGGVGRGWEEGEEMGDICNAINNKKYI